jgi:hypothetical protein
VEEFKEDLLMKKTDIIFFKKRSFHFPELLSSSWLWEILLFLTNSPSRTDPAAEAKRKENVICGWYICLLIQNGLFVVQHSPFLVMWLTALLSFSSLNERLTISKNIRKCWTWTGNIFLS